MKANGIIDASFRDPSGFLFYQKGILYRQVNISYKDNYIYLMKSGLYKKLVDNELLIPHEEVKIEGECADNAYKIIKPALIPFISYPYEWSFTQLKHAALLTLDIQKIALEFGMTLKDSSAYNIQFRKGKPIFIDTLSFEMKIEGQPWVAYKQFCEHFLGPLALMCFKDVHLSQLLRICLNGIPLDLISSILPVRTYFMFPLLIHLHIHSKSQKMFHHKVIKESSSIKNSSMIALIDNLYLGLLKLNLESKFTEWVDYYRQMNYSQNEFNQKKQLVSIFLDMINPKSLWDIGANTGVFSRIASKKGINTISFDNDHACVEKNYLTCVEEQETNILPLLMDFTNPSPAIGWQHNERLSLVERGPADTVLALAIIHHLAISNNLPLNKIAKFFFKICKSLIIEFVPKSDPQVRKLLSTRKDVFPNYTQESFEETFCRYFFIKKSINILDSGRTLYLMIRR